MVLPLRSEEFYPPAVGRQGRRLCCSLTSGIAEQILEKVDPEFTIASKIKQTFLRLGEIMDFDGGEEIPGVEIYKGCGRRMRQNLYWMGKAMIYLRIFHHSRKFLGN